MTIVTPASIVGNVHYRHDADNMPGNGVDGPLDVTGRLCVPCAIVGNARQGAAWSDDGVPLCSAHAEFYRLDQVDREALVQAWSSDGARVAVLRLFGLYGSGHASREVQAVGGAM